MNFAIERKGEEDKQLRKLVDVRRALISPNKDVILYHCDGLIGLMQ